MASVVGTFVGSVVASVLLRVTVSGVLVEAGPVVFTVLPTSVVSFVTVTVGVALDTVSSGRTCWTRQLRTSSSHVILVLALILPPSRLLRTTNRARGIPLTDGRPAVTLVSSGLYQTMRP